jgi:hypothetical protein
MQVFSKLFALTLFCGLISQSGIELAAAQDSNTTLMGRWIGGPCTAVAVEGTRAYFGNGPYLMIAEVSDPSSPAELGRILLPGVRDITVSGNLAYVAAGAGGLRIVDVSDPANPNEVGFFESAVSASDVAINGNYAYVAAGDNGLRIIDVSNPASPTEVGFLSAGYADAVATSGNFAFVAGDSLHVINVSNPASPTQAGALEIPDFYFNVDVAVSGNFVYIGTSGLLNLLIVDVSNPASPTEIGVFKSNDWVDGVAVNGDFVYLANENAGLRIISVAIPASPIEVGFFDTKAVAVKVAVSGSHAYVADNIGLRSIEVSNFANPTEASFFATSDTPLGVEVSENHAYLSVGAAGLKISAIVASLETKGCTSTTTCGGEVAINGDLAYFADGEGGLRIFDVSAPANPSEVGAIVTEGVPVSVAVSGNYAYVTAVFGGLRIFDVSNPASPTEVGFYANCCARSVDVSGNFAFVAGVAAGLRIIDVSNPAAPTEVSFFQPQRVSAWDVRVSGNYAYLADRTSGLRIFDVSNPANPTQVGLFAAVGAIGVEVSQNFAYVAQSTAGLRIIDVSNPASPQEVGLFNTDGSAFRVAVNGNLAYVADQGTGLYIIRNDFTTGVTSPSDRTPERFHLRQSYPNPLRASVSNSGTMITFTLSKAANVTLEVYNMLGEKVTTLVKGAKPAGEHVVNFNASSLPSGIYFYTLRAGDLKQTRKMVLTR